ARSVLPRSSLLVLFAVIAMSHTALARPADVVDGPVRLALDGPRGVAIAAPVAVRLAHEPTREDVALLRALGLVIEARRDGSPRGRGRVLFAELPEAALEKVAALPWVEHIALQGPLVPAPLPLDFTAAEIHATDAWRTRAADAAPLTGAGLTICDVD